jgi:hypothetical protein
MDFVDFILYIEQKEINPPKKTRKFFNSHLFWLNSHPFFVRPIICRLNLSVSAPQKKLYNINS